MLQCKPVKVTEEMEQRAFAQSLKWFERKIWFTDTFYYSWYSPLHNFFWWVVKSCQYAIVLWDDFDWDWKYILRLLKYKLERTKIRIVENNIIEGTDEIAREIDEVIELIRKIDKNEFAEEMYDAFEKKWGHYDFSCKTSHGMLAQRANVKNEQDAQACSDDFKAYSDQYEKERTECWNKIFEKLRDNMQNWWD
jgi:hypothetical protein